MTQMEMTPKMAPDNHAQRGQLMRYSPVAGRRSEIGLEGVPAAEISRSRCPTTMVVSGFNK